MSFNEKHFQEKKKAKELLDKAVQKKSIEQRKNDVTRRVFLEAGAGYMGAGVVASIPYGLTLAFERGAGRYSSESESERLARKERLRALDASPVFREVVREYMDDFEPEMAFVLGQSDKDRVEGMSCAEYFRENVLKDAGSMDQELRAELSFFIPGLPAVESRYDNDRVSDEGAISRVQALPSTLDKINANFHEERYTTENIMQAPVQASLMRQMMVDAHKMLVWSETEADGAGWLGAEDSLKTITRTYFGGDEQKMRRCFLVPAILTSHQAGIGSVTAFVRWAADHPVDAAPGGYDPFFASAKAGAALPYAEREELGFRRFDTLQSEKFFARMFAFALLFDGVRRIRS